MGSTEGISTRSLTEKVWLVAQALGDIAFAYPFSVILIEIQVCSMRTVTLNSHNLIIYVLVEKCKNY